MAQWKQIQQGTMRLWVQPLASIGGSRIQRCYGSGVGQRLQLQLDP